MQAGRAGRQHVTVVVADDEPVILEALTEVLADEPGLEVVGTARTGEEALARAKALQPDIVLLDVRMPGGGPTAARALAEGCPTVRVVALSAHTDARTVADMLVAGAIGFLGKGALTGDLAASVRACARGEVVIATDSAAAALRQLVAELVRLRSTVAPAEASLADRERASVDEVAGQDQDAAEGGPASSRPVVDDPLRRAGAG